MFQRRHFEVFIEVKRGTGVLGGICGDGAVKSVFPFLPQPVINGLPGKGGCGLPGAVRFFPQPPVRCTWAAMRFMKIRFR